MLLGQCLYIIWVELHLSVSQWQYFFMIFQLFLNLSAITKQINIRAGFQVCGSIQELSSEVFIKEISNSSRGPSVSMWEQDREQMCSVGSSMVCKQK